MSFLNPVFSTENVSYRDGKRYAWLMSLLLPAVLGCAPLFYLWTGSVAAMWIPVLLVYGLIPLLDAVIGEDRNNPPEEVVPLLEADGFYRWAAYALVPVLWLQIAAFEVERGGGRVRLRIDDTLGWGDVDEYVGLHIIGAMCLLLETVSGMPLPDTLVSFAHAEPTWVGEYETRLRGVAFAFGADAGVIDMPEAFGAAPCITADPTAFRQAVRLCERTEERRQGDGDAAQRVLDRLLDRQGDYPTLSEMAKDLYMSNRTLIRKLKAQGTSYQMLLDDVRQELAVWYLRHSDMRVEAIAERLGYRDTTNFSRTCKRWFGLTPRAIRG